MGAYAVKGTTAIHTISSNSSMSHPPTPVAGTMGYFTPLAASEDKAPEGSGPRRPPGGGGGVWAKAFEMGLGGSLLRVSPSGAQFTVFNRSVRPPEVTVLDLQDTLSSEQVEVRTKGTKVCPPCTYIPIT